MGSWEAGHSCPALLRRSETDRSVRPPFLCLAFQSLSRFVSFFIFYVGLF